MAAPNLEIFKNKGYKTDFKSVFRLDGGAAYSKYPDVLASMMVKQELIHRRIYILVVTQTTGHNYDFDVILYQRSQQVAKIPHHQNFLTNAQTLLTNAYETFWPQDPESAIGSFSRLTNSIIVRTPNLYWQIPPFEIDVECDRIDLVSNFIGVSISDYYMGVYSQG